MDTNAAAPAEAVAVALGAASGGLAVAGTEGAELVPAGAPEPPQAARALSRAAETTARARPGRIAQRTKPAGCGARFWLIGPPPWSGSRSWEVMLAGRGRISRGCNEDGDDMGYRPADRDLGLMADALDGWLVISCPHE